MILQYIKYNGDSFLFSSESLEVLKSGTPWMDSTKYWRIGHSYIHRMIFEHRNGKVERGLVVDHIDNNRFNNCLSNLQKTTHSVNVTKDRKPKSIAGYTNISDKKREGGSNGFVFEIIRNGIKYRGKRRKTIDEALNDKVLFFQQAKESGKVL